MQEEADTDFVPSLFRLSDEGGSLEFSLVSEGTLSKRNLDPSDGEVHNCVHVHLKHEMLVQLSFE